jgi:hypothetical protein
MKTSHKITLELPDEVFKDIVAFKRTANIPDAKTAVFELIKYALTLPPYFADFDWQKAEDEADADIAAGKIISFSSVDDFLADLKA